jgi:hypothetical protein
VVSNKEEVINLLEALNGAIFSKADSSAVNRTVRFQDPLVPLLNISEFPFIIKTMALWRISA